MESVPPIAAAVTVQWFAIAQTAAVATIGMAIAAREEIFPIYLQSIQQK
jgi:hypothetical protein